MIENRKFTSHNKRETFNFAFSFANKLEKGTVVILDGELGAGKTIFVKGVTQGLNIKADIKSPTYIIANSYKNGYFNHIDAYRIKDFSDFDTLGIDYDNSISMIEWGLKFKNYFKNNKVITVKITKDISDENIRYITIL